MLPDETIIISKIQKYQKNNKILRQHDSGGVDNMEKYKYMMGQAHAYLKASQEFNSKPKELKKR